MKDIVIIKIIFYFLVLVNTSDSIHLSLDGNEWTAINQNKSISVKATVPGSIYSDLRRNNVLKQDLYNENNDINYRWVSYDNWTFERTFSVDSQLLSKDGVYLVTNGLDTVSNIYINDKLVGKTDNMFVRYRFDIKHELKVGKNIIRIAFESAIHYSYRKAHSYSKDNYPVWSEDCKATIQQNECHGNFIRKMQSSFSWDWGPAFPTQGIWKSIGIEAYNSAIIRDISVETIPDASNSSQWTLIITAYLEEALHRELNGVFNIHLNDQLLVDNQKEIIKPESDNSLKIKFVKQIKTMKIIPWYPNGVADNTQTLYSLNVTVSDQKTNEVFTKVIKIGFRKIELIEDKINPIGNTFYFKVNGKAFYAKGSNWIPANILTENISKQYLLSLLLSAKEANMNMLRVWGGGVYESDYFYQLADELGIMIWQDFMFACALYPTDPEFLKSVDTEVVQNVRRLQHHPSIAIWAGNNENEIILSAFWYYDANKKGYVELYINHVRKYLLQEDNTRPFVGSSPSNGVESIKENYTAKSPNDLRYGDVHYYNDFSHLWDWKTYPSAKFVSEYGIQAYPSIETMSQVIKDSELTFPISGAIDHHQRKASGGKAIEAQISMYMKLPSHGGKDRFNDLIYLSQISQAMAIKTETEFYRRNREIDPKTGNGFTMGALYWQLNDIWQGPTWASIEFGGKWKLLHSYAKNFFKNQLVLPFEDKNEILKVSLVRDDYLGPLVFKFSLKIYEWNSVKPMKEITSEVKTDSFSSAVVYTHSIPDLLKESHCQSRGQCLVFVKIENSGHNIEAENIFLLTEPKNSNIVKPNIKVVDVKQKAHNIFTNEYIYDISFTSQAIAPFVLLDFKSNSGISGRFSDNGFFIFGNSNNIEFKIFANITTQHLRDNLVFKTLTDVV